MDLVVGARQVFVVMEHVSKTGEPKIVTECTYPLTGARVVDRIYTDCAVIDVTAEGLAVRWLCEGMSFERLQSMTAAPLLPGIG
jgi:3-oxoadipate CoA-transferase beta subunit